MRTAAQRALFKQNSARAVQAAGSARHRSQPREDINAGDTTMVWRNNKLIGRKGWTGPGVVVAVSPTRTSFWISMRGCLLKCSSEEGAQGNRLGVARCRVEQNSGDGTVEEAPEKRTTWLRRRGKPKDNQLRNHQLTQDQT